jgi:hypothetical protein
MNAAGESNADGRGWFRRVKHTPVQDAARGRINGRLDLDHLLDHCALPPALRDLVRSIVRRARLWRSERIDVAQELIAHFADGLGAGRPPDELARDFGDPAQAAKLIRRAKKRNRPAWWHAGRFGMYGLGVLVLFYIALAVRFYSGSPTITRDYVAELNRAALAVPEDQRAWPLYRQALLALGPMPDTTTLSKEEYEDVMAAYVERNVEAIAMIRKATTRPRMGYVAGLGIAEEDRALWPESAQHRVSDTSLLIGILLPALAELRRCARLLRSEATLAAQRGDGDLAAENIIAALRIAEHAREQPTIINDLVSLAIVGLATHEISRALWEQPESFSDEGLLALAHTVAGALGGGELRVRLEGERMFFEDFVQRSFTDDGRGGGRLSPGVISVMYELEAGAPPPQHRLRDVILGSGAPLAMLVAADRRSLMERYDRLMTLAEVEGAEPLWTRNASRVEAEIERMNETLLERLRYAPIMMLMPALMRATVNAELATQQRDAAIVAIALELHRRHHGDWPATLGALVPRFLPAVPPDRFDGQPLRYRVIDGRPVVYSVGANRIDHGGLVPRTSAGEPDSAIMRWVQPDRIEAPMADERPGRRLPEGDWILWPPME